MPDNTVKTPVPDLNKLLADAGVQGVKVVDQNPAKEPELPKEPVPDGTYLGAFRGGDGRYLHKYTDSNSRDGFVILPKKVEEMTEEDFMATAMTMSDPVANRVPLNLTVKWRDPQWAGYWAQRKVKDGQSVRRLQAMGFVTAKREDCEWLPQGIIVDDGEVTDGDLVLMKIPKVKLFSQFLSAYYREAMQKGGKQGYTQEAHNALGQPTNKVSHYAAAQTSNEFTGLGPIGQPMSR